MNSLTPFGKPTADDFYWDTEHHLLPKEQGCIVLQTYAANNITECVDHRSEHTPFIEEATFECEKQRRVKTDHDQAVFGRKTVVYIGMIVVDDTTHPLINDLCAIDQWATGPQEHFATSVEQAYAHLGYKINPNPDSDPVFARVHANEVFIHQNFGFVHV